MQCIMYADSESILSCSKRLRSYSEADTGYAVLRPTRRNIPVGHFVQTSLSIHSVYIYDVLPVAQWLATWLAKRSRAFDACTPRSG